MAYPGGIAEQLLQRFPQPRKPGPHVLGILMRMREPDGVDRDLAQVPPEPVERQGIRRDSHIARDFPIGSEAGLWIGPVRQELPQVALARGDGASVPIDDRQSRPTAPPDDIARVRFAVRHHPWRRIGSHYRGQPVVGRQRPMQRRSMGTNQVPRRFPEGAGGPRRIQPGQRRFERGSMRNGEVVATGQAGRHERGRRMDARDEALGVLTIRFRRERAEPRQLDVQPRIDRHRPARIVHRRQRFVRQVRDRCHDLGDPGEVAQGDCGAQCPAQPIDRAGDATPLVHGQEPATSGTIGGVGAPVMAAEPDRLIGHRERRQAPLGGHERCHDVGIEVGVRGWCIHRTSLPRPQ